MRRSNLLPSPYAPNAKEGYCVVVPLLVPKGCSQLVAACRGDRKRLFSTARRLLGHGIEIHPDQHDLNLPSGLVERPIHNPHKKKSTVVSVLSCLSDSLSESDDVKEVIALEAAPASDCGCGNRLHSTD